MATTALLENTPAAIKAELAAANQAQASAEADWAEAQAKGRNCPSHVRERTFRRVTAARQRFRKARDADRQLSS